MRAPLSKRKRTAKDDSRHASRRVIRSFRINLLKWYAINRRGFPWRRTSTSQYVRVVSEVLLQRTRAETVAAFFPSFIRHFPSWKALASASEVELQSFLKPIGLWRRRAASLSSLASAMAKRNGRFPHGRMKIETLPNVGQYIANAILLFSRGECLPLLDTNMARVLERHFGPRTKADIRYDEHLQELSRQVVQGPNPRLANWAILDLAAKVCTVRNPRCKHCPVLPTCKRFGLQQSAMQ